MKKILIMGLPGSGKTHLAKKINHDNEGKYMIIDDITINHFLMNMKYY